MEQKREYNNDAQCTICNKTGISRQFDEMYWTCDHCQAIGGIFNEPQIFVLRIHNSKIKYANNDQTGIKQ